MKVLTWTLVAMKAATAVKQTIGGEPVVMAPNATMGTEPLTGFIAERKGQAMPKGMTPAAAEQPRRIEINVQREGGAAALIKALNKADAKEVVAFSFTQEELARAVRNLTPLQRHVFINAGLKAALLAE